MQGRTIFTTQFLLSPRSLSRTKCLAARGIKNGPRILDLDIIFAENQKIETANLQVPHPRCFERRFVLQPLLEIFPDGNAFGFEFKSYIDKIEGQAIRIADKINPNLISDEI